MSIDNCRDMPVEVPHTLKRNLPQPMTYCTFLYKLFKTDDLHKMLYHYNASIEFSLLDI